MYYGLTRNQVKLIIHDYAIQLGVNHNISNKTKMMGNEWLKLFLKRNSSISLRKPEGLSLYRINGFTKVSVNLFFENLSHLINLYNYPPSNIFNVDEIGLHTSHTPRKILAGKGAKRVMKVISSDRGELITVTCCFNANGYYIPPMFTFPRKNVTSALMNGSPKNSVAFGSPSGWNNSDIFSKWMEHFMKFKNTNNRTLLIMDNHSSRISLNVINLARANAVDVLSIPPHSSHRIQPLDVSFFGSLRQKYNNACDEWLLRHLAQKITIYQVAEIFNMAYSNAAVPDKGKNGFRALVFHHITP